MIILSTVSYPTESTPEMAKRFLELPKQPDFLTKRGPYFKGDLNSGIVAFSIYELEKDKLAEGAEYIGNYLATYFGVPGFKYEITTCLEAPEALKLIGM